MRDFVHYTLIGSIGKIYKYNLRDVQPYPPVNSPESKTAGPFSQGQAV